MNYKESAQVFADNMIDELLDSWQCKDWGCSVKEFMQAHAKAFTKVAKTLAKELNQEDEEDA